jgi:diaminopimelate decarboxylase
MMALVRELWSRHLLSSDVWLDIGGGFPYDHAVPLEEQTFLPSRFFSALADAWGAAPRPPLLTEPGRLISAPTMAVVSRVLASKPRTGEPTIVVLDSGTNHNVMAAFYEHLWLYTDATTGAARHRFCGPLCMEDDVLSGERHAAPPKNGALVATFNAGAYSVALSRSFIQPRPPIFTLQSGGGFQLLQYRETPDRAYEFGKSTLRQPGHKSELRGS